MDQDVDVLLESDKNFTLLRVTTEKYEYTLIV